MLNPWGVGKTHRLIISPPCGRKPRLDESKDREDTDQGCIRYMKLEAQGDALIVGRGPSMDSTLYSYIILVGIGADNLQHYN